MNIAIAGAGPAGLLCAWQLCEYGHEVTIFERMHDLSKQGSGVLIQPIGLAVFERLGIRGQVESLGRKIQTIDGRSYPSGRVAVEVDYRVLPGTNYAIGIDRSVLWRLLHDKAVTAGTKVEGATVVNDLEYSTQKKPILCDLKGDNFGQFDFIVDASGARSPLRAHALRKVKSKILQYGSVWSKIAVHGDTKFNANCMHLFTNKHNQGVGILPTGQGDTKGSDSTTLFFNLDWANYQGDNLVTMQSWIGRAIEQWPETEHLLSHITEPSQLYLAKFSQHTLLKPYGEKIAFIGDAAHASNPQLGQGINLSLVDAFVLPWALSQKDDLQEGLEYYSWLRRNHVFIYQTMARLLTPFYQSDIRIATNMREACYPILSRLFKMKSLTAALISGGIGRPLRHIDFDKPSRH